MCGQDPAYPNHGRATDPILLAVAHGEPALASRDRPVLKTTSLLGVTRRLQVQEGIVHLIADEVWKPRLSPR